MTDAHFSDNQLLRYSRHILLNEIGVEGQQKIRTARMLVIGAGGLGSPAAYYLASAGVASIVLVDGDAVDLTNLQRQILHTTERVGTPKAHSGQAALRAINPEVEVTPIARRVDDAALQDVAPTILHLLGLPIPTAMDGRVLDGLLDPAWLAERPVRFSDDDESIAAGGDLEREDEEEIEDRLRGLGYL